MIKRPEFWALLVFYRVCVCVCVRNASVIWVVSLHVHVYVYVCVLQRGGELAKEIGGSSEVDGIGCGSGFWLNDEAGMWV